MLLLSSFYAILYYMRGIAMKVVLSRKGVDTGNSKMSNLVITNNGKSEIVMIPIPSEKDKVSYKDLTFSNDKNVNFHTKEYIKVHNIRLNELKTKCHADPNLSNYFNDSNFLGSIGQVGISLSHLEKHNIKVGDIFIFFGRFSFMDLVNNQPKMREEDKHLLFGYLQVGEIIYPNKLTLNQRKEYEHKYPWIVNQPHWNMDKYKNQDNNCIYIASEKCSFDSSLCGYGTFNYDDALILTKENEPLSHWSLSREVLKEELSYHNKNNVKDNYFQSALRGQEFVFTYNEKVKSWAENLIKKYGKRV